jgi:uncharacterized MnhB-related membrane protein
VTALIAITLALVAMLGGVVALTPDPARQSPALSVFGLVLTVLFMLLGAPDVALSELAVGGAVTPLLVLLTVRTVSRHRGGERR